MATTHITHHEHGTTVVKVVLEEGEAWHGAHVIVSVRKPTHTDDVAHVALEATEWDGEGKDGTLYIQSWEDANDDSWENHYPDYFPSVEMLATSEVAK